MVYPYFNSRPSARGDEKPPAASSACHSISIHAPPRGATQPPAEAPAASQISIHAPPRGATRKMKILNQNHLFQFTPLREGRRYADRIFQSVSISIHAPPRGATKIATGHVLAYQISIHAPPRGATGRCIVNYFQFAISIHAPPRGATPGLSPRRMCPNLFQFTPLREGRPNGGI